jgi:phosphate-selective porin OprO/OprP
MLPAAPHHTAIFSLLAAVLSPLTARAETPGVRVGPIDFKPYLLLQLDEGGTFNKTRDAGQATGFNTRRARIGIEAAVAKQVEIGVIYDFRGAPGSNSRFFEADFAYTGLDPFVVRAGIFKPAFTLEYAQSAGDILFLERASIVDIVGGLVAGAGRTGAQVGASGDRWFVAAFLTGGTNGPGAESDQRAALGRIAGLAIKTDNVSLHLGASGAWLYRVPGANADQRALNFSDQPELQIDTVDASLSTGPLKASGARMGGFEAGLTWNRLWVQAEWYGLHTDRSGGAGRDLFFSGEYIQASYTLLGKPRQWKPKIAAWSSPSPVEAFNPSAGQWGAVEIAARVSAVNLSDADVHGGRQIVWTAGVSWYPVEPLKFVFQYQHADTTAVAAPRRLDAVAVRGQVSF